MIDSKTSILSYGWPVSVSGYDSECLVAACDRYDNVGQIQVPVSHEVLHGHFRVRVVCYDCEVCRVVVVVYLQNENYNFKPCLFTGQKKSPQA